MTSWRKGQDSNLRGVNLLVFKTSALNHSATLPRPILPQIRSLCYNIPMKPHSYKKAFTVPEILVVAAFATLLLILFFIQKGNVDAMSRDEKRKTAINAMYYALEESFYEKNHYYPEEISESVLTVIDPELFTDPDGLYLNTELSSYHYEATNCKDGKCKSYTLRAELEKEDTYVKRNRN